MCKKSLAYPQGKVYISNLTVTEIRATLLLGFIAAVVYPLLPDRTIDPWNVLNPRSVWLTVIIVSGLSFVNYVLLRNLGYVFDNRKVVPLDSPPCILKPASYQRTQVVVGVCSARGMACNSSQLSMNPILTATSTL